MIRKIVGVSGLITLIFSLTVHLLTYLNINSVESYPAVWTLFPVVIAIFIFTIIILFLEIGNRPPLHVFYQHTLARMPILTWIILALFLAYFIFSLFWFGSGIAVPHEIDGKYNINNHGQITVYTREEVERIKLYQLRSYSGFWMWLMLCSTLYLLTAKNDD
jgi:hypothetical protein